MAPDKCTLWFCSVWFTMSHTSVCFQDIQDKMISPEKAEEAKLKARYPNLGNKPGGSDLLRKRLQKGVSYLLRNPANTCRFHSSTVFEPTIIFA